MTAISLGARGAAAPSFFRTTIGRKVVMAVTGVILVGFLLGHMAGNLQMFLPNGPDAMQHYAVFLRTALHGTGLWIARGGLLVSVLLHIWAAWSLTMDSRAARPTHYRKWEPRRSTLFSRTMRWTGVLVLLYVIWHLLEMTFGIVHPAFIELDPYHNLVTAFQRPLDAWMYVALMVLLGFHLAHGIWSMLRTLGVSHPRYVAASKALAAALAIIIVLGFISIPIAVQFGVLS
jgi:succinate dehydrogenase cytochrome b subunit